MREPKQPGLTPLGITLLYLVFALLWILLSDQVLDYLVSEKELLSRLQTFKGWLFVLVTAGFLYGMVSKCRRLLSSQIIELEQERHKLAERESLYRVLTEAQQSIIVRLSSEYQILYANPAFTSIFGRSPDSWIGASLEDWPASDEQIQSFKNVVDEVFESGAVSSHQIALMMHDGERIFDCLLAPELGKDGSDGHIIITAHDITQLVQAQRALERSEATLRSLFNAAPLGIGMVNSERVMGLTNRRMQRMLGYSKKELQGKSAAMLYESEAEYQRVEVQLAQVRKLGQASIQTRWVKKSGEAFELLLSSASIDPDDWEAGVMVTAMDLSGILEARMERELLAAALDQAAECIVITDTEGVTIYINSAYESLTGYSKSEMLGRVPDIFDSSAYDPYFQQNISRTLKNGEIWQGPMELLHKSGTVFETETAISPVKDQKGTVTNFVAVQRDVSNERRLEAQLQQAHKMEAIGTLAGGIAHDFNNILGAINGYAELALSRVEPGDKLHEYLLQVQQGGDRAGRLVKQILTFSRQTGQEKKPLLLGGPVKEALSLLRASLPSTIAINQETIGEMPMVLADPTQLHQVLMNLCTNAAHAMGAEGGEISISLKSAFPEPTEGVSLAGEGPYACLMVSDTGPGMSPRILQRIFDPFFTTKKPGEGTGMGLAMVHGIVKAHGGEVVVSSQEGKGTTFKVYLPMLKGETRKTQENLPPIPRGSGTVMLVDDELTLVEMTGQMLESLGYAVLPHTSSVEALAAFRANPMACDILITDLTMPKLTGMDLAAEIIDIRPDIPVIMCTGFSETGIRKQAAEAGIKSLLMKPLNRRNLAEEMRKALGDTPEPGPG